MTPDPTAPPAPPASGESLADTLARQVTTRPRQGPAADLVVHSLHELGAVDRAVYEAVARTPTGTLDGPVRRLSAAADKSKLWLGIAAAVALAGGKRGRRAALEGVVAIGVSSATINLGVKPVARRRRPDRVRPALFEHRHVPMPGSTSFPSGHAASAFAFAYAVGRHLPAIAVPIRLLAAAVAYSRVHTGVHYPGDVVIGSDAGSGTAAMVAAVADRAARSRAVSGRAR
ncbi:MAG TPA: phosphatase PAP2 family protein [Actinomycetota bacterium]|nr:phosphatase PAP2 family protein [Actinomycetota bacterium]